MIVDEAVLSLIDAIYGAALDKTRWPDVLHQIMSISDCQGATFYVLDSTEQPRLPILETANFAQDFIDEYLSGMAAHDPTVQYIIAHPQQKIVHDSTFITEREKDRHMYFDWHGRFSETRHRIVNVTQPAEHVQAGVALHRTRAKGDFNPAALEKIGVLFHHVERAVEIGFRLGTLGWMEQVLQDLLDRNPLGILLLDDQGRVIFANREARSIGNTSDGLALAEAGLTLARAIDNRRLQKLIGEVINTIRRSGLSSGGSLLAARPSHKRPYSILVSPLARTDFGLTRLRPAVCIVIADPEKRDLLPADRLRSLYGLTPAEARLAMRLAAGDDLRSAAAALGIAYPTARTELMAIFRKTETRRQGELIMLLLKTVPLFAS